MGQHRVTDRASTVGLALILLTGACGDDAGDQITVGQEAPDASVPASTGDDVLARVDQATTWTEAGLFVYGGRDPNRVIDDGEPVGGAVVADPDTGALTPVPEPPFGEPLRSGSVAAAVGGEVFLFGERCDAYTDDPDSLICAPGSFAAAVYDIEGGSWRSIDLPDGLANSQSPWIDRLSGVTTDGLIVLELVPEGLPEAGDAPFWTYSIAADEWTQLADPGVAAEGACVAGNQLVVVSGEGEGVVNDVRLHTLLLEGPGSSWSAGSPAPQADWDLSPRLACGGDFALVHGHVLEAGPRRETAFRLDLTGDLGQWSEVPQLPEGGTTITQLWTGDRLLLFDQEGGAVVFDPSSETWSALELPAQGTAIGWTGEDLVVLTPADAEGVVAVEVPT